MFTTNLIFHHGKLKLYENITKPQWADKIGVLTQNDLIIFSSKFTDDKEEGKIKMIETICCFSKEGRNWKIDLIKHNKKHSFMIDTEEEAKKWHKMIVLASSWSNYEQFCEFQKLKPWIYLLRWAARANFCLKINLANCNIFAISEFLRDNVIIKELMLEQINNNIGVLSQVLLCFKPNQLVSLILSSSGLDDEFIKSSKQILSSNNFLEKLDLSNNLLTNLSIPILFKIFINTPFLNFLSLSGNKLEDYGIELLIPEILTQIPLKILLISNCSITDASLCIITGLFKIKKSSLIHLDISKNEFTVDTIEIILKENNKYTRKYEFKLDITPLPINEKLVKYIDHEYCIMKKCRNNKPMPKVLNHRDTIGVISKKLDSVSDNIFIEDLVDIINELSHLDFQFPRIKLEKIEKIAQDYLSIAISQPNYYCLELLVPAFRKIGFYHQQAEEMLNLLYPEVEHIVNTLEMVLSPELYTEENIPEINSLLDIVIKRCDELFQYGA